MMEKATIKKEQIHDYLNPSLTVKERVENLLSLMTLEEKIAQMVSIWNIKKEIMQNDDEELDLTRYQETLKNGMGQIARLSDTAGGLEPREMAELANTLQKFFVEETRLGIPVIFHEECLHGLAAKSATSYPQPIGLASTFNPELIEEIYTAISEDTRSRGAHQALTPVVDIVRDPRWGRVEETFGEDPYLVSRLGIAAVKGFQGDGKFSDKKRVIATLKHFAAHGNPESGSNCGPANYSERELRDNYLYPFKEVIDKAGAISVMASYNEIDGLPSHANKWLLRDVLREEWGFKGFVVSDYFAITELNEKEETVSHKVAKDKKEAALLAAKAGVNIELPDYDCYPYLKELVEENSLDISVIDELVSVMLEYKFKLGLFEEPYVDPDAVQNEQRLVQERELALKAAQETITLLKNNNNILPLDKSEKSKIAVIGPNADRKLLGGYSGQPSFYTSVLEGIKAQAGDQSEILYAEGCRITTGGSWEEDLVTPPDFEEDKKLIAEAVKTAEQSDKVILVVGGNEQTSREAWNKDHMGDRPNLDLYGSQNELVRQIVELGKPVVVVLFNGRPKSINYIAENVDGILECWYLGQETGKAVADVVFGDFNPGGKLPISFPRSAGHIPCHYNYKPSARRGYLFDDINPLFSFGYGLSYTSFKISDVKLKDTKINNGSSTEVSLQIENTGNMIGTEVVQMYIRDIVSSVTRPVKELKGFEKIELKPGQKTEIKFAVTPDLLKFTNVDKEYVVEPGEFEIMIGNSSRDEDVVKLSLEVI